MTERQISGKSKKYVNFYESPLINDVHLHDYLRVRVRAHDHVAEVLLE